MLEQGLVDVSATGAVRLGRDIVCDGFIHSCSARVQSHVHADHLEDFETSKGYQDILTTKGSYDLLVVKKNADLPYRDNFKYLEYGKSHRVNNSLVKLLPSNHILGAAQIEVELEDGIRLGYSGDFQWPLETPIKCDVLVLDSTHGCPKYQRRYSQEDVEDRLEELLIKQYKLGPLLIRGHTGLLQRAMTILSGIDSLRLFASETTIKEYAVYQAHGYPPRNLMPFRQIENAEARAVIFLRMNERPPRIVDDSFVRITLSQYISDPKDPILVFGERDYRVALSDHAEFQGILDYVAAVSPKAVVTDNSRGGHGVDLSQEIIKRLGIPAVPSSAILNRGWGE